jgi:hypothetical protein
VSDVLAVLSELPPEAAAGAKVVLADPATGAFVILWRKLARLGLSETKASLWPDGTVACRWYRVPLTHFRWTLRAKVARPGRPGNPAALQKARPSPRISVQDQGIDPSDGGGGRGGTGPVPRPRIPCPFQPSVVTPTVG